MKSRLKVLTLAGVVTTAGVVAVAGTDFDGMSGGTNMNALAEAKELPAPQAGSGVAAASRAGKASWEAPNQCGAVTVPVYEDIEIMRRGAGAEFSFEGDRHRVYAERQCEENGIREQKSSKRASAWRTGDRMVCQIRDITYDRYPEYGYILYWRHHLSAEEIASALCSELMRCVAGAPMPVPDRLQAISDVKAKCNIK